MEKPTGGAHSRRADKMLLRVSNSGDALAAPGGYANTGIHIGDVVLSAPPTKSHYIELVRSIAPRELLDRDAETQDLKMICESADYDGQYIRWLGDGWSGKTALMSWFFLQPVDAVLVGFFINDRWPAQNTRSAFVESVSEQLAEVCGRHLPPPTEASREPTMLALLSEAATLCRAAGRNLVLLIDGMDEDRGVRPGAESHSIAALLPVHLPQGLRVVTSGRPHPPIPDDVAADHPLRNAQVRTLIANESSIAIRHEMEREIKRLVHGDELERAILGLTVVASGGLSSSELAELTEEPEAIVLECLRGVAGRTFSIQPLLVRTNRPHYDAYALGHSDLPTLAESFLGRKVLSRYFDRMRGWASRYAESGWGPSTPMFLALRLAVAAAAYGDLQYSAAVLTDTRRQALQRELTGGDYFAIGEINVVRDEIIGHHDELSIAAKLAAHVSRLIHEGRTTPELLPIAFETVGLSLQARARCLATDEEALSNLELERVAEFAAEAGKFEWALELCNEITSADSRDKTAVTIISHATRLGKIDLAKAIAESLEEGTKYRIGAMTLIAITHARNQRVEEALAAIRLINNPGFEDRAAMFVANALALTGDTTAALTLARAIDTDSLRLRAIAGVAGVVIGAGEIDLARELIKEVPLRYELDILQEDIAVALAIDGRIDEALELTEAMYRPGRAYAAIALYYARSGDFDNAESFARRAGNWSEILPQSLVDLVVVTSADEYSIRRGGGTSGLAVLVTELAAQKDFDRAEHLATVDDSSSGRTETVRVLVTAFVESGQHSRAGAFAENLDGELRDSALGAIAVALARNASLDAAAEVLSQMDQSEFEYFYAIQRVAEEAASSGSVEFAVDLVKERIPPHGQSACLLAVARQAQAVDPLRARSLVLEVDDMARRQTFWVWVTDIVGSIASGFELGKDIESSESTIAVLNDEELRQVARVIAFESFALTGDLGRMEHYFAQIRSPSALTLLCMSLVEVVHDMADSKNPEEWRLRRLSSWLTEVSSSVFADRDGPDEDMGDIREELSRVIAAKGEPERALAIAQSIEDHSRRSSAIYNVAVGFAAKGDFAKALTLFAEAPAFSADTKLHQLPYYLAKAGLVDEARTIADSQRWQHKDWVLVDISVGIAAGGSIDRALEIAESIGAEQENRMAIVGIAVELASQGEWDAAMSVLSKWRQSAVPEYVWRDLATVVAEIDDHTALDTCIANICSASMRDQALESVAAICLDRGFPKLAAAMASRIDNARVMRNCLCLVWEHVGASESDAESRVAFSQLLRWCPTHRSLAALACRWPAIGNEVVDEVKRLLLDLGEIRTSDGTAQIAEGLAGARTASALSNL